MEEGEEGYNEEREDNIYDVRPIEDQTEREESEEES